MYIGVGLSHCREVVHSPLSEVPLYQYNYYECCVDPSSTVLCFVCLSLWVDHLAYVVCHSPEVSSWPWLWWREGGRPLYWRDCCEWRKEEKDCCRWCIPQDHSGPVGREGGRE